MPFRPVVNSQIVIGNRPYTFVEHPVAKGMPYGQTGRRATVYKIVDQGRQEFALKVFTHAFRSPWNAEGAQRLQTFASLPGMQVCNRSVITPGQHSGLVDQFPDLEYAVIMPWVQGETWYDIIESQRPVSMNTGQEIAFQMATILAGMEQRGLAHCDISGPNVLVDINLLSSQSPNGHHPVAVVDVEEMFGPGLQRPDKLPAGTPGYAHRTAVNGLWSESADRFAGAVILAEMLTRYDERVRRITYKEHYFAPNELQNHGDRYQLALQVLREQGKTMAAELFARAWFSNSLAECPTFAEWYIALNGSPASQYVSAAPQSFSPQPMNVGNWRPISNQPRTVSISIEQVKPMLITAAEEGRWQDVLAIAPQILQISPADVDALTLQTRAQRLAQLDQAIQQTWQVAAVSGMLEDWDNCIRLITTAQHQAGKVDRYEKLKQEAEKERQVAIQAAAFEQLISEKRWDEARQYQSGLPKDHPQLAGLSARLDIEMDRQERLADLLRQAQEAATGGSWNEATRLCREGLVLDPGHAELKSLLETSQEELALDRQVAQLLASADGHVQQEKWDEAEAAIREALELQPKRESITNRFDNILQWKNWGERLRHARRELAASPAPTLLKQIEDIPSGFSDVDDLRDLLESVAQWHQAIQTARGKYELDELGRLLNSPPVASLDTSLDQNWLDAETWRRTEFTQAWAQYEVEAVRKLLEALGQDHPLRQEAQEWVEEYEKTAGALQAARDSFAAVELLGQLGQLPNNFPGYDGFKSWAEQEINLQNSLQQARRLRDVVSVEGLVKSLPASHPAIKEFREWLKEEKTRRKTVDQARQGYDLDRVTALLAQIPESDPEYARDWEWLEEQRQFDSDVRACLSAFDVDGARNLLNRLPADNPHYPLLQEWLTQETTRRAELDAAMLAYDFDLAESLSAQLPQGHPYGRISSDWLAENRDLLDGITQARQVFDHEKTLELLGRVEGNFPGYEETHQWAIEAKLRRDKAELALKDDDIPGIQTLINDWPEDDPYLNFLNDILHSLQKKQARAAELHENLEKAFEEKNWGECQTISQLLIVNFSSESQRVEDINQLSREKLKARMQADGHLSNVNNAMSKKDWFGALRYANQVVSTYADEPQYVNVPAGIRNKLIELAKQAEANRKWNEARKIWNALKSVSPTVIRDRPEPGIAKAEAAEAATPVEVKEQAMAGAVPQEKSDDLATVRKALEAGKFAEAVSLLKKADASRPEAQALLDELFTTLSRQAKAAQEVGKWGKARDLWNLLKLLKDETGR